MNSLLILLNQIVELYIWVLIINAIASWLVAFNVINTGNRFVYIVLETTYKLTDPPLRFIRNYIPNLGSIDISPVILILGLIFLKNFINEIFYKAAF
jgi:YggT family protein|tara:strand:+ start:151 stop:441 length:291 start_codon:yes stop_codon:yes gene_type:complete